MAVVRNRKKIEDMIYAVYDALDPSGKNTTKYKTMFSSMDDKAFGSFFKRFLNDDKENFILDIVEFEHTLTMDNCEDAAKVLGIPLMERVFMPHLAKEGTIVVSPEPCLVGWLNVKRTQQLLHKKNGLSISNEKRSSETGQVVGDDKNARDSDIEASMLVALGADKVLAEFHGPRADDYTMAREMRQSISANGYVMLDELTNDRRNKVTLNSIHTYLLGMGIKSDLISDTYILPRTADELFG